MATKNAGTAEHAAEGKIAVSTVATWNDVQKSRLQALQVSEDLSEEEANELVSLIKARKAHNEQRAGSIAETKQALKALGIAITDLFTKEEIIEAAGQYQIAPKAQVAGTSTGKKRGPAPGSKRKAKGGTVLFAYKATGAKGAEPELTREQPLTGYVSKHFKAFYDLHGDKTGEELLKLPNTTEESRKWLTETPEGKQKMIDILKFLKEGTVNPK